MTWWLWLLLGVILAALELVSSGGFYLIFFGVAAMFIGLMSLVGLAGPLWLQWVVFAVLSLVLLLAFRRPILKMLQVDTGPVDSLVGEIAVVVKAHAPDPYRPRVKVLLAADRTPLARPYEINLWESHEGVADSVEAPLDPADYGIDPLAHM